LVVAGAGRVRDDCRVRVTKLRSSRTGHLVSRGGLERGEGGLSPGVGDLLPAGFQEPLPAYLGARVAPQAARYQQADDQSRHADQHDTEDPKVEQQEQVAEVRTWNTTRSWVDCARVNFQPSGALLASPLVRKTRWPFAPRPIHQDHIAVKPHRGR
jgi:hypothetical protein